MGKGVAGAASERVRPFDTADHAGAWRVEYQRLSEPAWFPVIFWLYLPLAIAYLCWRPLIVNWATPLGPLMFGVEIFTVFNTTLYLWMTRTVWVPVHRPVSRAATVDVLITTVNEPLDIIERTVAAAMQVRGIRAVLVLDDGGRESVASLASRYGARWIPRSGNEHAKAGNLNHGLLHTDAEFLLELDVDHIPHSNFVERTLGYFDDPEVAVVQTPQTYYNTESFLFRHSRRATWSEQGMFYDIIQPAKNRFNSAFFVGTSALLRRGAIDSIGGYARGTATEDIHTALRLHAAGWKSVFLPEVLAEGLEAASLREFYRQRRRWAAGSLGLLFRSADSPLWVRGLTIPQRFNYLAATFAHLQGVQRLALLLLSVLTIFTLQAPIVTPTVAWVAPMGLFAAFSILATALYARGTYHPVHTEAYGLVSWTASLAGLWGVVRVQKKFSVSRKVVARDEGWLLRAGLWGLIALVSAATLRGAWLLATTNVSPALTVGLRIGSGLCLFYVVVLGSFLVHLLRYERGKPLPQRPLETAAERGELQLTTVEPVVLRDKLEPELVVSNESI